MDLVHPVSTFGMNIICHLIFPQRDSKACQCVQKQKQPAQEQGLLRLEVNFPLKELHSMAEIPRVKMTLAKITPGICVSEQ